MKAKLTLFLCAVFALLLAACGGGGGGGSSDSGTPGSGKKLLVAANYGAAISGGRIFTYDDQNRLISDNAFGEGNSFVYQGDSIYPTSFRYGQGMTIGFALYTYGTANLNGAPTKYYQTQLLNNSGNPIAANIYDRYYLNADDRIIANGRIANGNYTSYDIPYTYDARGNLLKYVMTTGNAEYVYEFTYDDKKGKTSGAESPLWLFGTNEGEYTLRNPNNQLTYSMVGRSNGTVFVSMKEAYSYTYDSDGYPIAADVRQESYNTVTGELTMSYRQTYQYAKAK
jgi:hypothetical protein